MKIIKNFSMDVLTIYKLSLFFFFFFVNNFFENKLENKLKELEK